MCAQFESKDKLDRMQNCGMCRHYKLDKCEVVDEIKHELEPELCDWCGKPANDCESFKGCRACGTCRAEYKDSRERYKNMQLKAAMSRMAVNAK